MVKGFVLAGVDTHAYPISLLMVLAKTPGLFDIEES